MYMYFTALFIFKEIISEQIFCPICCHSYTEIGSLFFCKWAGNHGASNARLYHVSGGGRTGAWSAKFNNKGQWLEVDLGETTKVTMVVTQGRYDYDQWVKSYKVAHSKYGDHFEFRNKVRRITSTFLKKLWCCAGRRVQQGNQVL